MTSRPKYIKLWYSFAIKFYKIRFSMRSFDNFHSKMIISDVIPCFVWEPFHKLLSYGCRAEPCKSWFRACGLILKIHENSSFFKITSRVSMGLRIGLKTIYNTQTSHLQASELIPVRTHPIYNFWNFDFFDFMKFTWVQKFSFVGKL